MSVWITYRTVHSKSALKADTSQMCKVDRRETIDVTTVVKKDATLRIVKSHRSVLVVANLAIGRQTVQTREELLEGACSHGVLEEMAQIRNS